MKKRTACLGWSKQMQRNLVVGVFAARRGDHNYSDLIITSVLNEHKRRRAAIRASGCHMTRRQKLRIQRDVAAGYTTDLARRFMGFDPLPSRALPEIV